uniref:Uncharacterized protein n=1 Tax=Nymphaea colorata TaxID=210225 RepID=A0A5K1AGF7_9MAGN
MWRQEGQEECEESQVSMQLRWKQWAHWGRTLICSPGRNSVRQMAQSVDLPALESKATTGSARIAFFLRPLLAEGSGMPAPPTPARRRKRQRQAQRAMNPRPTRQMRVQRRAARMTTTSESTVPSAGAPSEDDDGASRRRRLCVTSELGADTINEHTARERKTDRVMGRRVRFIRKGQLFRKETATVDSFGERGRA